MKQTIELTNYECQVLERLTDYYERHIESEISLGVERDEEINYKEEIQLLRTINSRFNNI